jgi:mono/diheme cytochrome c family protein
MMTRRWLQASMIRRCMGLAMAAALFLILGFMALIAIEIIAYKPINTGAIGQNTAQNKVLVERGAYLAKLGNCAACHTDRGGLPYAGGKAIHTPFGAVFASNITPDAQHGIGLWSADAFYRALHEGVNAQGKLLTPAFPYTNYTHITREDSDALHAYFTQAVAAVPEPSKAHELQFPFNTQLALAVWRVLFFTASDPIDTTKSIANYSINTGAIGQNHSPKQEIDRGEYLVRGLAHCSACHAERNALGAARNDQLLSGALMPMQDWYAPSLHAREEAGVQHWPREQVVALLKNGVATNASVLGPMAEVVSKSTQFWSDADLQAATAYLQSLPLRAAPTQGAPADHPNLLKQGAQLYAQHCATCHGDKGQGLRVEGQVALPALAGNRAVTIASSANLVRIILAGGYAPSTSGNPRPYGMPPFVHVLTDEDIASVTTYIRSSWGNSANAVSASQVIAQRRGVLQ